MAEMCVTYGSLGGIFDMRFGQKLKRLRKAKKLTQVDVAARCDTGSSMISKYEKGESEPTFTMIKKLSEALEVRVGYLFDEIEEYESLSPAEVAVRESLFLYLKKKAVPGKEREGLWRVAAMPDAPITVEKWNNFDEMSRTRRSSRRQ